MNLKELGVIRMSKIIINIQSARICAFCKYWWDPACKYIMPNIGTQWFYESSAKCRCLKKNIDTTGFSTCQNFRLKVEY